MTSAEQHQLVQRTLRGEAGASDALVELLAPKIQFKVTAALRRHARSAPRRQDVLDLSQEVFVALLEKEGRVLRNWDPARGAALPTFVGLVADRVATQVLRSGRRSGWREDPTEDAALERASGAEPPFDLRVADRDLLRALLEHLRATQSPRGMLLFRALFLENRPAEDVAAEVDMSLDALYAWRSRTRRSLRKAAARLLSERGHSPQTGSRG